MSSYDSIIVKLNAFTKKYYTKILIKGGILFVVLGVLFFLSVTALEYFLWLNSRSRLLLLVVFVIALLFLLFKYVFVPLFYLFRIKKGISMREASLLIGKHFSDVDDKLVNLLDLAENKQRSALIVAAIEQRAEELNPIPFVQAVDFKESLKYAKYGVAPVLVITLIWLSGNITAFFGSYKRVVNYDVAYEPPAPFSFDLMNENLNVLEDEVLTLELRTAGKVRPQSMGVVIGDKELVMQKQNGKFTYRMEPPLKSGEIYFTANGFDSRTYQITVGRVPAVQRFEMVLDYPIYLNKNNDILRGTGNATVPEGTRVEWSVKGIHTEEVDLKTGDTTVTFTRDGDTFSHAQQVNSNLNYELATSNSSVRQYEKLAYAIKVVKDQYPTIKVEKTIDSLNLNTSYFEGVATDDIGLKSIELVVYPVTNEKQAQTISLGKNGKNVERFYYTFPSGLALEAGTDYALYFKVRDNDGLRGGKETKSKVFGTRVLSNKELKNKELDSRQQIIENMDKSLQRLKDQNETLKEINTKQKENRNLEFNDQNQIKDFLDKQQRQEQLMQKFSKELKDNLNKAENKDELNQLLQERLERQELEAQKNQKLLEELNKIADKIEQEDLKKELEEQAKKQRNSERNLEQLLELTKRYYVTEKAAQLARELEELAETQKKASEVQKKDSLDVQIQGVLNQEFDKVAQELEELKEDNKQLKKPLEINAPKEKQADIKRDQKDALEELNKENTSEQSSSSGNSDKKSREASKKQKSAAEKIKELSEGLRQSAMSSGSGSEVAEDAEMLRQILDNLIKFSFKQETLFDALQDSRGELSEFSNTVREQKQLRSLFEHVDDSLFALSLRRAELSEFVNEQITEVYYNIDKSLESIAENQVFQGASYQQYVLTASNSLSDFLANILENMQQSIKMGQGQGQGEGFQLPDIIKQQKQLGEKMGQAGKDGKQGEKGKGKKGQAGEGQEGKSGEQGSDGESGKGGEEGAEGKGGQGEKGNGGGDKGKSSNKNGRGGTSNQEGDGGPTDKEMQEIYEIYKEQQELRQKLEKELANIINNDKRKLAEKLVRQMENFEEDLIDNGITQRTVSRMNLIQQQLMKLENAALKQGEKNERESSTNRNEFMNPVTTKPELLKRKQNGIEILNRQALPLRQNFQGKVKRYFNNGN